MPQCFAAAGKFIVARKSALFASFTFCGVVLTLIVHLGTDYHHSCEEELHQPYSTVLAYPDARHDIQFQHKVDQELLQQWQFPRKYNRTWI